MMVAAAEAEVVGRALFVEPTPERIEALMRAAAGADLAALVRSLELHGILGLVARNLLLAGIPLDPDLSASLDTRQWANAEDVVRAFLAALEAGRDRAALVTYGDEARLVQPLTADLEAVAGALAAQSTSGSAARRLDHGLWAAMDVVAPPKGWNDKTRALAILTIESTGREESASVVPVIELAREQEIVVNRIFLNRDADPIISAHIAGLGARRSACR